MSPIEIERTSYPRVTDIISRVAASTYAGISLEVLANAAVRGQRVDEYCSSYLLGIWIPEVEPDYAPYFNSFVEWADKNVDSVLQMHKRLYDDEKRFTGEFDFVLKLKGSDEYVLCDLKATAAANKTWPIQLAAYKTLCESNGIEVNKALNIHLKKVKSSKMEEGVQTSPAIIKTVIVEHPDLTSSWEIFSSALRCYDYFERKEVKHVAKH